MPGEFSDSFYPKEPNEGITARVTFTDKSVVLTPALSGNRDKLNQKVQKEKIFRRLTSAVPGLYFPSFIQEDPNAGRYEMERASGFNLTTSRAQVQGGGMVEFFNLPPQYKTEAMLTYLRAIDAVNQAGYCFVDHKPDSVFIDPKHKRVSIVDTDALEEEDRKIIWERELNGGLQNVLRSFFTRNLDHRDAWTLIPAGPAIVIDGLSDFKSAHEAVQAIEGWLKGENTIHYGPSGTSPKEHLGLLARTSGLADVYADIQSLDFSKVTDYARDMIETEIYMKAFLNSEEPKMIDKFTLGIGR